MNTILCNDMVEFFAAKNLLESKGLFYVPSQKIGISRGKNYIKYDDMFFSLTTKEDYNLINNQDEKLQNNRADI